MNQYQVKDDSTVNSITLTKRNENKTALVIQWIGMLSILVGLIIGVFMNSIVLFLISGVISGVVLIGFGEIIRLLHEINERQKQNSN